VDSRAGLGVLEGKITKNKDIIQFNTAKVLKNHITDYLCQMAMTV
jgi:hypothetical protein